jgi:hypothetical protein
MLVRACYSPLVVSERGGAVVPRVSWRREFLSVLQGVLLGLVVTFYAGTAWGLSSRAYTADFVQFYASAKALRAGESIYQPLPLESYVPGRPAGPAAPVEVHPNLSSPLAVVCTLPFAFMTLRTGYLVWTAISLVLALTSCWCVWGELRTPRSSESGLMWLWIVFLAYFPTFTAFKIGQVTFWVLMLLTCAWLAARHGHERLAGLLLGAGVGLKLFVAVLIIYFGLLRRWRVVAWSLGVVTAGFVALLPIVGLDAYRDFIGVLRSVTWFGNSWNASYSAVITRIFGGSENVPLIGAPLLGRAIVVFCSAASLAALVHVSWRPGGDRLAVARFDLGYGLALVMMLLVSPLGWMYYFPLLLIPACSAWREAGNGRVPAARKGLVALWILSAIPTPMMRANQAGGPLRWFTLSSVYFYALLGLGTLLWKSQARMDRERE